MSYWSTFKRTYQPTPVIENPKLEQRLAKVCKEDLDENSKKFIESLIDFYKRKNGLTEKQLSSFERIESRFSPEAKIAWEDWKKEYLENFIDDTKIVAKYYCGTGYYSKIANNICNTEGYIPTIKDYKRIVNNKYAQKVLENTKLTPRFTQGQKVQMRSTIGTTNSDWELRPFQSRICFVISVDHKIPSAVNGGKKYSVLPMGASEAIECEERHLMKPNKKGKYQ